MYTFTLPECQYCVCWPSKERWYSIAIHKCMFVHRNSCLNFVKGNPIIAHLKCQKERAFWLCFDLLFSIVGSNLVKTLSSPSWYKAATSGPKLIKRVFPLLDQLSSYRPTSRVIIRSIFLIFCQTISLSIFIIFPIFSTSIFNDVNLDQIDQKSLPPPSISCQVIVQLP